MKLSELVNLRVSYVPNVRAASDSLFLPRRYVSASISSVLLFRLARADALFRNFLVAFLSSVMLTFAEDSAVVVSLRSIAHDKASGSGVQSGGVIRLDLKTLARILRLSDGQTTKTIFPASSCML